jgi:hypothetical protein
MGDIVTSFSIEEMKRSILAVAFGPLTCLILLDGCTALQGRRVHLAQIPVSTIQVSPAAGPGIAPGEKSSFIVKITPAKSSGRTCRLRGVSSQSTIKAS